MSDSEKQRKHELECMRLASDLMALAGATFNPDLKAHCVRMAKIWSGQADQRPTAPIPNVSDLLYLADGTLNNASPIVLVVEDDPLLRMLAVAIVEEAGFALLEACDADEAFGLLEAHSDIALLFTDIHMPGSMDGLNLAHAVRERWPSMKILIVSGQVRLQPRELPSNSCFFEKPYLPASMVVELRSLMNSAAF